MGIVRTFIRRRVARSKMLSNWALRIGLYLLQLPNFDRRKSEAVVTIVMVSRTGRRKVLRMYTEGMVDGNKFLVAIRFGKIIEGYVKGERHAKTNASADGTSENESTKAY